TLAQPAIVAAVEELKRLNQELDLSNAAAPQLHVAAALFRQVAVDLPLHSSHRVDDARVHARSVDDTARQLHEAGADALVAGADATLEQGLPLPQLGALGVVRAVAGEREHHRAHAAFRPKPQIYTKGVALLGDRFEQRDDLTSEAREVIPVGDSAFASALRLTVGAVDEHQVDVGGIV